MFFDAAIERAAAEAQGVGRMADVAIGSDQSFADENCLHGLEAHFVDVLRRSTRATLRVQAEIGHFNAPAARHQDASLDRVIELANISRPAVLQHLLQGAWFETLNWSAIARCVTPKKMCRQRRYIFSTLPQRGQCDLDCIEAEKKILAKPPGFALRA